MTRYACFARFARGAKDVLDWGAKKKKTIAGVQFYCSSSTLEGFPLRMSGIDNSYKIDGDVLLVIHASIPPGVGR